MAVISQRVSDISNTVGTPEAPVNAYLVPVYAADGSLSFHTVDLTVEEFSSLAGQVQKATTKYVKAASATNLVLADPDTLKGSKKSSDVDYGPVREWAGKQVNTDGTPRWDVKSSGRVPKDILDAYNEANGPSNVPSTGADSDAANKAKADAVANLVADKNETSDDKEESKVKADSNA